MTHLRLLKEGKKKAKIEAIKYRYATMKKKIFLRFVSFSEIAKVKAKRVNETPNKVAPFMKD